MLLASWETSWVATSRVAERDGRLVGFIGAELDESLSRVWIHGPVVDDPGWDDVADALLAALHTDPRTSAKDHEPAGDVDNARLAGFAARHGFVAGKVHHVLSRDVLGIDELPASAVPPLEPACEEAFLELHEQLFPNTYYSGQQLVDQAASGDAVVLGLVDHDTLVGYVAGRIDERGDGYVDFVGVAPGSRRRGHGATLVAAVSRALAERGPIREIRLTVSSENAAALALYEALGFARVSSAVGYRRRAEHAG